MGKKDSKHKKKSHKKKHKKEKKRHKEKKSKHYSSDSSDSSSDSSSYKSDKERKPEQKASVERLSHAQDESEWNDLFSDRHATVKQRNVEKKDRDILDKPGQSARELNPYWKDGGNGLPPTREESLSQGGKDNDVKYLKNLLKKATEIAESTGESVAKIVYEEWGPLDKLKQIIEESEKPQDDNPRRGMFQRPSSPSDLGHKSADERRMGFMKPGDISKYDFTNTYKRNWRKKDGAPVEEGVETESSKSKETTEEKSESNRILTPDELNALAAKAMKAEIMGNKELCEKLRKEIEVAKKNREAASAGGSSKGEGKREEVVVLTKTNSKGFSRPCDSSEFSAAEGGRKRRRGETHKGNERVRYFLDDDKYNIKTMFEKEKFSTPGQSDEMFLKMAKKGKMHSINEDNDLDDVFLDRVRGSDYEKKESEKERNRMLNEAKTQHKCLSSCRWCLDNVQKHLIVSVGSKCYLCLPSDESLTNGHCLIVPVHHDSCGTQLDEDVWNEMQLYRKSLCRMFEENGEDVVFFENARSFHRYPHMVLHCVPIEKEVGDLAPIYFKKAIMESETEWSNNKKVIDLRTKDLRRSVPKGLPYFAVDFGMEGGFAHVIEDEQLFPPNFAEEIIGGMLDLDAQKWRKRRKESLENQKEKVAEFAERWKKYEFSESRGKRSRPRTDSSSSD